MRRIVFRLCGHASARPQDRLRSSRPHAMSAAISPPAVVKAEVSGFVARSADSSQARPASLLSLPVAPHHVCRGCI